MFRISRGATTYLLLFVINISTLLSIMGRQKQNTVYKYFEINKNCSKSKCLVCNKDLNSLNSSNLMKHLKIHKKEYEEVLSLNSTQKNNTKKSFNTEIVARECTKLVTIHGRPLALLDDEAFQNILSLIPNCNVKINSKNIKNDIIETAGNLRMAVARELQDKMICIKIDIASLALRSFMGINAQYLEEGIIVLKNLAMVELLERHTSDNLKEQVLFVLQRYRIGLENIYSFTTDNGANMLKMGKLLNETQIQQNQSVSLSTNDEDHSDRDRSVFTEDDDQYETVMEVEGAENASEHSDSDLDYDADTGPSSDDIQNEYTETITSLLSIHFDENTTQHRNIPAVRCAAHTLQLSVLNVCNNTQIKEVIDEARKAAKILRTQIYAAIIAKARKNQAILDCPTRWNSTVDMIKRLIELKDICDNAQDDNLNLTETTWNTLQDYLISLSPAKELSKVLQQEQLTIGDFYLQWLLCKIKLRNINTALSTLLVNSMENREQTLLNNDAFIRAVFLDGRVNSTLSDDQRESSKAKLLELHHHLKKINNNKENEPHSSSSSGSLPQTNANDNNARKELENFLSVKYVEAQSDIQVLLQRQMNVPSNLFGNLDEELTAFLKEPLLKSTENILKYWEMKKNNYPRLYKLACIVLATPATQVSVERLFSSLKFVVSRYRLNLKRSLIEDIIFIRNNNLYNKK